MCVCVYVWVCVCVRARACVRVCVCVCVHKMCQISKEAYKKCEIEIVDKGNTFWEIESDY